MVDTTQENDSHGHLEALRSTLHMDLRKFLGWIAFRGVGLKRG
jgi:hypothetical protein